MTARSKLPGKATEAEHAHLVGIPHLQVQEGPGVLDEHLSAVAGDLVASHGAVETVAALLRTSGHLLAHLHFDAWRESPEAETARVGADMLRQSFARDMERLRRGLAVSSDA